MTSIVSLPVWFPFLKLSSPQKQAEGSFWFVNQQQTCVFAGNEALQTNCRLLANIKECSDICVMVYCAAPTTSALCCLPLSVGGWFWGRGQRTRLNEFPAKCPRSQGRAPRQRMAKQSMQPLASSTPTRANLLKPRKLQVSPHLDTVDHYMTTHEWAVKLYL